VESRGPQWDLFANGVRIIAARALGDGAAAEDIAQEAVARALAKIGRDGPDSIQDIPAFVYGVARNLIADAHRSRYRTVPLDAVEEPAESRPDALAAAVSLEERERVREALLQLSAADRYILQLSFFDGLQPDEIAKRTKEPAANVRQRKSRALERLRRAFFRGAEARIDEVSR
jgi:RNA polymerase sigma factor (sigma-70 family)